MKTIAIYSTKGGVGKTTLCANLATHLSLRHKKKVLIIDLDPQANITNYMLGDELATRVIEPYYKKGVTKEYNTIIDVFDNYTPNEGKINPNIKNIICGRFHSDLIAGNPSLASYDDLFRQKWDQLSVQDDTSGLTTTNWIYPILQKNKNEYDYILIDLSPGVSNINKTAMLAADYFILPIGYDVVSLMAIKYINKWFEEWIPSYNSQLGILEKNNPSMLSSIKDDIRSRALINQGFLGYTVQPHTSRYSSGIKGSTISSYQNMIINFEHEVQNNLTYFKKHSIIDNPVLNLGEIPNIPSILALSKFVASPIADLNASDGLAGSQYAQAKNYMKALDQISDRIVNNIEGGHDVSR